MSNGKPNLSQNSKNCVAQFLHQNFIDGKMKGGAVKEVAAKYGVSRQSIRKIWLQALEQMAAGLPIHISNNKAIPRKLKRELDVHKLLGVKLQQRSTMRGLAEAMEVSSSTTHRWVHSGQIRSHTNAIKPLLSSDCKLARLKFCLESIHVDRTLNTWKFKCMKHVIHIDEKWFYLTRTTERYYLHQDEEEPHRTCKSKKFITKVMFLCAVSRPMYNIDGSLIFYGKIGMFPFTHQVAAKRKSKRRAAGTMETKAVDSITKQVIKSCLINQVLPAIKAKWPLFENTDILIQQDNARPHIEDVDMDFRAAASSDGFNIHLICQPSSSPDLNINDLGWFRALQALQTKRSSYTIDDLVNAVMSSFEQLSHVKLNKVFLTLQSCMIEIMKCRGEINYKIPHMGKDRLMAEGILPENLEVDTQLARDSTQYLVEAEDMQTTAQV